MITKRKLLQHFSSQAELAKCLDITRQAVCRWPDDKPIPREQELRLRYELRPDIFEQAAGESGICKHDATTKEADNGNINF